ncbi:hypothetical protein ACH42_06160 [Endozoicomonas sp. (ex Bugula neritina AB1)]|nr:hypothetical protein ACH42_06160 [Endozoicomonas sp. (ex Bugula neritina AB1)]
MQGSKPDNPSQQERVRQDYLEAMGIQTWFPRCQLPNAQPPRPFDWIQEDAAAWQQEQPSLSSQERPPNPEHQGPTSSYSRPRASDILSQAHINEKPDATSTPETAAQPVEQPKSLLGIPASSQFRLIIQSINEDCLVVAEMPHSGLDQFTRFHQDLLNDILFALKISPDANTSASGEFVWPLPERRGLMGHINKDDHSAVEAVCAFLSNQYGFARRKTVLLLGQAAARFVIDPDKTFDDLRGVQQGTHGNQYFATTYGLNELMKLPQHKAEAWLDLVPLLRNQTPPDTVTE